MNLLSKNISANLFSNVWLTVVMLAVTPFYISFLGVESYGLIGFYLSWVAILGILDTGISATAIREIAWLEARPEELKRIPVLLKSLEVVYWGIILVIGSVILAGAWFYGAEWFQLKDLRPEVVRVVLMLMAISLVLQVPSGLYIGGLIGSQRQVECSGLLAFFGTLRAIGSILVLWLLSPDIRIFFLWHIFASILQTGVMRWSLWRKFSKGGHSAKVSLDILRSIKGFAGTMMLITFLGMLMTQADKLILSRILTLEKFGFYMLAWTLASGMSRAVTPLVQAFSPRFTNLVSKGEEEQLSRHVRVASQLISTLIIPPTALVVFLSNPILSVWLGSDTTAEGAAPILTIMVIGTAFVCCSFPALSILYSKKRLKPVVTINLSCLVVLLPLFILLSSYFGAIGAAYIWCLYGLILYVAYQSYGLSGLPETGFLISILRDLFCPSVVSFAIAGIAGYLLNDLNNKIIFVFLLILTLLFGWFAAALACKDLRKIVIEKWNWKTKVIL